MLEGSSKYKQEAEGEGRERALEAEDRAEANGGGCEKLSGFGSWVFGGFVPVAGNKAKEMGPGWV